MSAQTADAAGVSASAPASQHTDASASPVATSVSGGHRQTASLTEMQWRQQQQQQQQQQQGAAAAGASSSVPPAVPDPPATVVLITSNLQHDFFTRFPKRKETMNRYWVGRKESERVLGLDPSRGPLAQLMTWVRTVAAGGDGSDSVFAAHGGTASATAAAAPQPNAVPPAQPSPGAWSGGIASVPPGFPSSLYAAALSDVIPHFQDEVVETAGGDADADLDAELLMDDDSLFAELMQQNLEWEEQLDASASNNEQQQQQQRALSPSAAAAAARSTPVQFSSTPPANSPQPQQPALTVDPATTPIGLSQLRSPNIIISPSPAPSSGPSTPSPSVHANLVHLTLPQQSPSTLGAPTFGSARPAGSASSSFSVPGSVSDTGSRASPSTTPLLFSPSSSPSSWALPPERPSIYVIHLRTCVERGKPSSRESVERYGEYCLAGTDGVRLCNKMDEGLEKYPHECIINTNRLLSSHTYRALKRKLQQIRSFVQKRQQLRARIAAAAAAYASGSTSPFSGAGVGGASPCTPGSLPAAPAPSSGSARKKLPLKVAVIGGWTDEDVYHICYELRTRFPATDIGTCSILTASPSTSQHWNTLSQLKRVMNVTVSRTIKELIEWFGVGMLPYRLPGVPFKPRRNWPVFEWVGGDSAMPRNFNMDLDGEILAHLYRNSSRIRISTLVGGYSASIVLSVESSDTSQVREAPSVVKLASRADIATEYQAFQRVEEMLGNNAPSVRAFVELGERAGVKFRYTRMSGGGVRRLLDLFDDVAAGEGEGVARVCKVLDEVYGEIFGGWYAAAHSEMFDLFSYWFDGFATGQPRSDPVSMVHQEGSYLRTFISYVLAKKGADPAPHFRKDTDFYCYPPYQAETFQFPHCPPLSNLGLLFEKPSGMPYLRTLPPRRLYSTFAHGDANLQNFLIDSRGNVWVIDFMFTEPRNHVLRDISKTWSCIMYLAAEITSDRQFAQAFLISEELANARDLHTPLAAQIPGLTDVHLKAIYSILCRMWSHLGPMVKDRSSAVQFQLALVADAMRFFLYTTRNMFSKRWALATAVLLSESVLIQEKRIHDVTPSWITMGHIPMVKGSLGMTRSPGNRNYMRFERRPPEPSQPFSFFSPSAAASAAAAAQTAAAASPLAASTLSVGGGTKLQTIAGSPPSRVNSGGSNGATPTSSAANFRRELTQEERAKKESTERLSVQAAHLRERLVKSDQATETLRLQSEHARLMHEQAEEKTRYEAEQSDKDRMQLLAERAAGDSASLAANASKHLEMKVGKKTLLVDEEEDAEDENDEGEQNDEAEGEGDDQADSVSAPPAAAAAATLRRKKVTRSDSANLESLFHLHEELDRDSGVGVGATHPHLQFAPNLGQGVIGPRHIVQSVSHPSLSHLVGGSHSGSSSHAHPPGPNGSPTAKKMPRLQKECLKLKQEGVTHLMLLITDAEFKEMGVDKAKLHSYMSDYGIQVITVSMPPGIMQVALIMELVKLSLGILCDDRGLKLVLVSKGGFHRAGTVAACILCALGSPPEQAIRLVRECRGAQAIGRDSREKNVMKFDLAWKNLLISAVVQAGQLTQNNVTAAAAAGVADVQQPLGQAQTYTFV